MNHTTSTRRSRLYRNQIAIIDAAQSGAYEIAGPFPTQYCMSNVVSTPQNMGLVPCRWRDKSACGEVPGRGRYGDLMLCKRVWVCPVCSSIIMDARAKEIAALIDLHLKSGGAVYLMTLTAPHTRADTLADLMDAFGTANKAFLQHRNVKRAKRELGYVGGIYSKEHTWGQANGWHYHLHVLWFVSADVDPSEVERSLYSAWAKSAVSAGLGKPSRKHGLDVRKGERAADYIAKLQWDLSTELALTDYKRGKKINRFTPFELAETGRFDLFFEYQRATYRRDRLTGIAALCRALTGLSSPDDAGLIEQAESEYSDRAFIARQVYKALRRSRLDETALSVWEYADGDNGVFFDFLESAAGGRSRSPASPFFMGTPDDVHDTRYYETGTTPRSDSDE